jgi:hypothetical protein
MIENLINYLPVDNETGFDEIIREVNDHSQSG